MQLSLERKLDMIHRVTELGERVTDVCKLFGVSRNTYYTYIHRLKAHPNQRRQALIDRRKSKRPSKISAFVAGHILREIVIRPASGPQALLEQVITRLDEPYTHIGFGITTLYKFLLNNQLNTYRDRLSFSRKVRAISVLERFDVDPSGRAAHVRVYKTTEELYEILEDWKKKKRR